MLAHMLEWYDLTDEERQIRDLALDVAREGIAPHAEKHDLEGTFVRDCIEALAESGLLGVNIPKEYGGLGGTPLATLMVIEAISAACASTGASFMFHCNLAHVITGAGPEPLRRKYLPQMAKDKLGSFAINEQVRLFREEFDTTIEEKDDHYLVNGFKPFSTSAGEADFAIVQTQRSTTPAGHPFPVFEQEYVVVEKGMPGLSASVYDPMGLRGASNGSVKLENVKVPKENIVGEEPGRMIRSVVWKGNSLLGPNIVAAGPAGAALEAAVNHARTHGQPEWMSHVLAPMSDQLNALRAYNYYGARIMHDFAKPMFLAHIEILRLAGEIAPWICDRAMEVMGGAAFMRTSPIQRYYRDARGLAYLAFAMDARRMATAEGLYAYDISTEHPQPQGMPWDKVANYNFLHFSAGARMKMPPPLAAELDRSRFEDFARERGSDTVTFDLYVERLTDTMPKVMAAAAAARAQRGGPPRNGAPGGPPTDGAPATRPGAEAPAS
jgi:alkylation response protein AidB-like acyl-CoA dehydrogenase